MQPGGPRLLAAPPVEENWDSEDGAEAGADEATDDVEE